MTLGEVLIATALTTVVVAGTFAAVGPAHSTFASGQERADLQQRLRVAIETLTRDLRDAASVRPYRVGAVADDRAAGIHFRGDRVSVVFPDARGMGPPADRSRSYYLKTAGPVSQLMQYDGKETAFPLLDDVIALGFEYFGEPQPPRTLLDDDAGEPGVRVSYGPAPPPAGADDLEDGWGPGENCAFRVADGQHIPRLASLGGTTPVPLSAAVLTDGPWCPDAAHAARFDADLLRIRLVRVRLRLQATAPFRGVEASLFTYAGTASDIRRYVPDSEVRIDVAPRNWNAAPAP